MLTRTGDVARELGVANHVVRYWCDQFGIRPSRHGGQRVFSLTNIERLKKVKHLLKDEGLTIAGAKAQLGEKPLEPSGDGKLQYCPHCGISKPLTKLGSFCKTCGKRVTWTGPLWGSP